MISSVFRVATILVKIVSEATSSLFRHPILENNRTTRVTFDFFTLFKLRGLSLPSEEVVCSDNISPLSKTSRLYLKMAGVYLFDRFSDSLKLKSLLRLSFTRLIKNIVKGPIGNEPLLPRVR